MKKKNRLAVRPVSGTYSYYQERKAQNVKWYQLALIDFWTINGTYSTLTDLYIIHEEFRCKREYVHSWYTGKMGINRVIEWKDYFIYAISWYHSKTLDCAIYLLKAKHLLNHFHNIGKWCISWQYGTPTCAIFFPNFLEITWVKRPASPESKFNRNTENLLNIHELFLTMDILGKIFLPIFHFNCNIKLKDKFHVFNSYY